MGPACHPLCTIKLSFLELFLAPHIWSLAFFFRSHATFETLRNLLAHGTRMSSSMCYKSLFSLNFFSPSDFWLFPFSFERRQGIERKRQWWGPLRHYKK